jgi:nucleoside-diphosphate kinase
LKSWGPRPFTAYRPPDDRPPDPGSLFRRAMKTDLTCLIVKPDGVGKRVVGKIIDRLETEGLQLLAMRMVRPTPALMEDFYAEHKGKPFFPAFLRFVASGPIVVTVWQGDRAVERVRQIIGATDSQKAAPGTLRKAWGTDQRRNLVHASDSPQSAAREVAMFFSAEDVAPYDPDHWLAVEKVATA